MPWASIGGSIASSVIGGAFGGGSKAGERAARDAAALAQAGQEAQVASANNKLAPFVNNGTNASNQLAYLLGTGGYTVAKPTFDDAYNYVRDAHFKWAGRDYGRKSNVAGERLKAQKIYDDRLAAWEKDFDQWKSEQGGNSEFGSLLKPFSQEDLNNDVVYNSGLQFGLDEGTKAIDSRARASGSMDSGSVLKELTRFGNDYGSTKANEAYSRNSLDKARTYDMLGGQAGQGLGAVGTGIGVASNAATNIGNSQQALASNLMASANNRADNTNNAFQSLLGNLLYNYKNTRNSGVGGTAPWSTPPINGGYNNSAGNNIYGGYA
jgi:hypothetical protein